MSGEILSNRLVLLMTGNKIILDGGCEGRCDG